MTSIARHVEHTCLSSFVVRALLDAGLTPPHRDVVDRVGFSAVQVRALVKALSSPEAM